MSAQLQGLKSGDMHLWQIVTASILAVLGRHALYWLLGQAAPAAHPFFSLTSLLDLLYYLLAFSLTYFGFMRWNLRRAQTSEQT